MLAPQSPVLRSPAFILLGGLFLAFLGALGTVFATWSSREVVVREWEGRLVSVAQMLSAHAGQSIGSAEHVLQDVTENIEGYGARNADEMKATFTSRPVFDMLSHAIKGLPHIDVVTIVARDGTALNTTHSFPAPQINLADRDYFKAQMDDPKLDVFLSQPVQNRGTGTRDFYFTRKIKSPTGETLGLILIGLDVRFFADFYASLGMQFSNITLFRTDGTLLAQHSLDGFTTTDQRVNNTIRSATAKTTKAIVFSPSPNATQRAFEQMTSYDVHPTLPIAVSISATRQEILKEWENAAIRSVTLGGTMTALIIAATILLSRMISELEAARNMALVASDAKMRFASNVSHELRTPMNAIIGGSHQLMQTELSQDSQRYAGIVASAAQQLMVLINDILDFSYYEARHFRIENAPFEVRDLANSTLEMARALVVDKHLDLTCDVARQVPHQAIGDAGRIKQVLLNLLSNAIKFTDQGNVCLRISFHTGTQASTNQLIFDVIDSGPGISHEDRARIFQPFERALDQTKGAGTGLGLTICKKLVEAMSGNISIKSRVGLGTCVTVTLPASIPPDTGVNHLPKSDPQQHIAHSQSLNILIAEDVAPSHMLLTMMCEKMGHQVVAVENGRLAVEAAQAQAFDLVLMDLQMPELDGRDATRRIRAGNGPSSAARILAVSANADLDGPNGLAALGFDDVLLKPVTPARLDYVIAAIAARV